MHIDYHTEKYVMFEEASVLETLRKIESQKGRIMFVVSEHGRLCGVVTNGDILRWLTKETTPNLQVTIGSIANKKYRSVSEGASAEQVNAILEKVLFVPILDEQNHLVAVARRGHPQEGFRIGNRQVGETNPCFVIAEIGNNHNGSLAAAFELIDAAVDAGADCCKFQMRQMEHLYHAPENRAGQGENLGAEYVLDLLARFQLSNDELFKAFDYCNRKGVIPMCTPWDGESLRLLEEYGLPGYKVASADLTNHELLSQVVQTRKPMLCSTGMSTESEIKAAVALLRQYGASYILLHCNSTYPAPFADVNLKYLRRLKEIGSCIVGYSGHERGTHVSVSAVALGAKVIERHITFDRSLEGNDHKASLLPDEFEQMVKGIREVETALGTSEPRELSQGEMINRVTLAKSLMINCDLDAGKTIRDSMVDVKSPGRGLQPLFRSRLVGTPAKRDLKAGDFFFLSDIENSQFSKRNFDFSRPYGIPVRFHDYSSLAADVNMDLVEFHLSYKDLDLDFRDYLKGPYQTDLVVHAPELFAGDHTLDLCSDDKAYRRRSIQELQRVIELTNRLKTCFPKSQDTLVIVNVGGFSDHGFLSGSEQARKLDTLASSLDQLDKSGVELIPQTMPPFPWHFGGQRFHNLFVSADQIETFCRDHSYRICFDTSHSFLACAHNHWSFHEFCGQVAPYIAYLHIADAAGTDGEGLQVLEGEIDFAAMRELLDRHCPNAGFIPEIWQGHENDGEGFWAALSRLEALGF